MTPRDFWLAAAQWGCFMNAYAPGACMYGFDERGMVQSEAHRAACIAWIEGPCQAALDDPHNAEDYTADRAQLDAMLAYLRTAPLIRSAA